MELYLQLNRPEGKKVGYLKADLKPSAGFVLYPDKPTKVPDEEAKRIMAANKGLVGTDPFRIEEPAAAKPEAKEPEDGKRKALESLASLNLTDLTVAEMNVYFESLEAKVPPANVDKKTRARMLEKACEEAFETL